MRIGDRVGMGEVFDFGVNGSLWQVKEAIGNMVSISEELCIAVSFESCQNHDILYTDGRSVVL